MHLVSWSSRGHHVEHIVPEVLGCPPGFILPADIICKSCNNGMGHLDQAVADDFDFLSFQAGIPRKKGKPAVIASRGNVYGFKGEDGPSIYFNMDSRDIVATDGTHVAAYRGSERNVKATFEKESPYVRVSFDITLGKSKKFQRGIYKIAFSALAYFLGPNVLFKAKYDRIRQYVRKGSGTRHFCCFQKPTSKITTTGSIHPSLALRVTMRSGSGLRALTLLLISASLKYIYRSLLSQQLNKSEKTVGRYCLHDDAQGLNVFLASISLKPGDRWADKIVQELRGSAWVVFLASRNALASANVQMEIGGAVFGNKKLVPIMWDVQPSDLPPWITQHQGLTLSGATIEDINQRVVQLAAHIKEDKSKGELIAGAVLFGLLALLAKAG